MEEQRGRHPQGHRDRIIRCEDGDKAAAIRSSILLHKKNRCSGAIPPHIPVSCHSTPRTKRFVNRLDFELAGAAQRLVQGNQIKGRLGLGLGQIQFFQVKHPLRVQ